MNADVATLRSAGLRAIRTTGWHLRGPWALPLFFAVLAAVGTGEALRLILKGDTSEARAGGWYLLLVSALIALGASGRPDRATGAPPAAAAVTEREEPEVSDSGSQRKNRTREAVIFFVSAFTFAWALPWVGFAVANGLFVTAYLVFVDHRRWWNALWIAALVDACLIFGLRLLDVVLPTGVFGLGF